MSVVFHFSPACSPARDTTSIAIDYLQFINNHTPIKVQSFSPMDQSSRNRLPYPPRPVSSSSSLPAAEPHTRTDQLGLARTNTQPDVSPTLATGIAMLTAQLETLQTHPDFTLSFSIGIGSYCRTAKLHNGTWQGHDLTHHFDDHRSSLPYDELNQPSMMQQQVPPNPSPISAATPTTAPESTIDNRPTQPTATQQIVCILPTTPLPRLPSPPPSASISVRRLDDTNTELMLPSSLRGEGVEEIDEARTNVQNTDNTTENTKTSQKPRIITMRNPFDVPIMTEVIGSQDSYDALLLSTSSDPHHLIGFQTDPDLHEQQKEQEKAERRIAKAPIDLRDVLNKKEQNKIEQLAQKKRARDLANANTTNPSPNLSPIQQPEARRVRLSDELLSQTEARQYDITARDAVRLQREVKSRNPDSGLDMQKFDTATSKGNPEDVKNLEKASIGMHYLRPVKKPVLLLDRIPPWFERVRENLHKDKSSLVKPLPSKIKLSAQRPARYDDQLLKSRDFMRDVTTLLPWAKKCYRRQGLPCSLIQR